MPINPAFLAARRTEQLRRLLAHQRLAEPITIAFRSRRVAFSIPQCALTERHRVELVFARNSFFTGLQPLLGDVFQFLWRCHPLFFRPDGTFPNHRGPVSWWLRFRACYTRRTLLAHVRRCDLVSAAGAIRARLAEVEQDALGAPLEENAQARSPLAPDFNYFDSLVDSLGVRYGYTPDEILDLPRALVHQLARNHALSSEDGELLVFAPSDQLLSSRTA